MGSLSSRRLTHADRLRNSNHTQNPTGHKADILSWHAIGTSNLFFKKSECNGTLGRPLIMVAAKVWLQL